MLLALILVRFYVGKPMKSVLFFNQGSYNNTIKYQWILSPLRVILCEKVKVKFRRAIYLFILKNGAVSFQLVQPLNKLVGFCPYE